MALIDIGGISYEESTTGSGTGNYNSFLRLQANGDEDGVNTDDNNVGDNKGGIWTHSILLSSLEQVLIDGVLYYEIRLDLNEGDSDGAPAITLEDLRIFFSDDPATGDDYDDDFVNLSKVYDLGDALNLTDINSGSGTDDYRFLIPVDLFEDAEADDYFTLYSRFTGSDGGFEEWRVRSQDVGDGLPIIHVDKVAAPTLINEGTPTDITYTYELTNLSPGEDALEVTSFIDDNGTPGDTSDDVDLLDGVAATLSPYYVSGDADLDGLLDKNETWTFSYTREDAVVNAGNLTNIATVNGIDEEGNNTHDDDDAVVTVQDVDPTINIVKTASPTQVQAGSPTLVTFTYAVTNTSPAQTDEELTITSLIDDFGTPSDDSDDKDLLVVGTFVGGDDDLDGFLDTGETWTYTYTTSLTLNAGEVRTNVVTVIGEDDEGTSATDNDDASVTGFNLGRTPGFWSNNGSKLWDGEGSTMPKGGNLGIALPASGDLLRRVEDMDLDGDDDTPGNPNNGTPGYLLIGDWDKDGIADANENVLRISREDAMALLNSSLKLQQDGRYMLARDVIASWLNYLGGSFVGDPNNATADSVVHYIDQAVAWLIESTVDENNILLKSELSSGTKVGTNTGFWHNGYDINGGGIAPALPAAGQHDIGDIANLDILGGSAIHAALDHYNNYGFI